MCEPPVPAHPIMGRIDAPTVTLVLHAWYLVPHIDGDPVQLPAHRDPELGAPGRHYHFDERFLREPMPDRETSILVKMETADTVIEWLPARLWRLRRRDTVARLRLGAGLQGLYAGQVCQGKRCPHRGADLSQVPADGAGITTCPMHGLRSRQGVVCA